TEETPGRQGPSHAAATAGPRQAGDEARTDGIGDAREHGAAAAELAFPVNKILISAAIEGRGAQAMVVLVLRNAMKLPRRKFLHLAASAAALPAASRIVRAQTYPSRPGASLSGLPCWWHRHHGTPDRPMVVGAAGPAIRYREPAGCWHQYRHRGDRECTP